MPCISSLEFLGGSLMAGVQTKSTPGSVGNVSAERRPDTSMNFGRQEVYRDTNGTCGDGGAEAAGGEADELTTAGEEQEGAAAAPAAVAAACVLDAWTGAAIRAALAATRINAQG